MKLKKDQPEKKIRPEREPIDDLVEALKREKTNIDIEIQEDSLCPKCYEGKLVKPKVFYRVFEGRGQPDFICDTCGALSWKLPEIKPLIPIKEKEAKKTKEEEEFEWTRYI